MNNETHTREELEKELEKGIDIPEFMARGEKNRVFAMKEKERMIKRRIRAKKKKRMKKTITILGCELLLAIVLTAVILLVVNLVMDANNAKRVNANREASVRTFVDVEVSPGDTFSEIINDHYKRYNLDNFYKSWKEYLREVRLTNDIMDMDEITSGQHLCLPCFIDKEESDT